jgi:Ran GTPase-activating protein (RanGAP) involved in mRNA processing and transport
MRKLADIMAQIKSIVSLDISWNQIPLFKIIPLLEVLSKHRKLEYLNLAFCNILDEQSTSVENETFLLALLGKMIKHNQHLLHLDLSSIGLGARMIEGIGEALRKAKSLLCIHLSGNPGLTEPVMNALIKRIRCRPNEDIERFTHI